LPGRSPSEGQSGRGPPAGSHEKSRKEKLAAGGRMKVWETAFVRVLARKSSREFPIAVRVPLKGVIDVPISAWKLRQAPTPTKWRRPGRLTLHEAACPRTQAERPPGKLESSPSQAKNMSAAIVVTATARAPSLLFVNIVAPLPRHYSLAGLAVVLDNDYGLLVSVSSAARRIRLFTPGVDLRPLQP
jgi:hypothetical protein